jgi:hypothetical protein
MIGPTENTLPTMTESLRAALKSLPVEVVYGRQRLEQAIITSNRIEVNQLGPERFGASMGSRDGIDPSVGSRTISVEVVIDAHNDRAGADQGDHERLANFFADCVFAFFLEEGQSRGEIVEDWSATGALAEPPAGDMQVGARYVLNFSIGRSVKRLASLLEGIGPFISQGAVNVLAGTQTEVTCNG